MFTEEELRNISSNVRSDLAVYIYRNVVKEEANTLSNEELRDIIIKKTHFLVDYIINDLSGLK